LTDVETGVKLGAIGSTTIETAWRIPMTTTNTAIRDEIRDRYAAAARAVATGQSAAAVEAGSGCCGGDSCCGTGGQASFGADLYPAADRAELPQAAVAASLGCGNPLAVADLHEGETVLDLGSGGGGDVLLSARRVGPTGRVYGLDMTDEMLALARRNVAEAGASNVELRKGTIEDIPLPDASVDVVISNCVINLSTDKRRCSPRCTGCSGPAAGSGSPTWWPRTR
jgi:arsenite methyltransferase